jgi:PEGA domain
MMLRTGLVVLVLLAAAPARGEEAPEDVRAQASRQFQRGNDHFKAHDYSAALTAYQRAYEILPNDKALVPIASCLQRLARFRESIDVWKRVALSDTVDPSIRADARAKLAELESRLGRLVVTSEPSGAEVLVDGLVRCRTPCDEPIDPRAHDVVIGQGQHEERRSIAPERGETVRLDVALGTSRERAPSSDVMGPDSGTRPPPAELDGGYHPGPLTWIGGGVALLGGAGVLGFGLRAESLFDDFDAEPHRGTFNEGRLSRDLANASIAVAAGGLVLLAIDLLVLAPSGEREPDGSLGTYPGPPSWRRDGLSIRF